jgi:transposase
VRPGHPEAVSFDYIRHGTTTLFVALEVATGKVTEACTDRHRHQEFVAFLRQVAAAYPRRQLHVVVDNLATHTHPAVRAWLERHPRVRLHFTPTSGSWLNLVEAFFSIITRQALRRGDFPTVADLIAAIERFIAAWNDRCRPFTRARAKSALRGLTCGYGGPAAGVGPPESRLCPRPAWSALGSCPGQSDLVVGLAPRRPRLDTGSQPLSASIPAGKWPV